MEFNNIIADLTYLGSTIRELTVKNHIVNLGNDVLKEFGFDFEITNIEESETERTGRILMQVSVYLSLGEQEKDEFTILLEGVFSVPIKLLEQEFINLLAVNGSTALYSIARAKLETVSAVTFKTGKLTLPMINMLKFLEEKNKAAEKNEKDS